MAARNSEKDKRMAAELKRQGVERRTGKCALCYRMIANDTFGGNEAARHLTRCVSGPPAKKTR